MRTGSLLLPSADCAGCTALTDPFFPVSSPPTTTTHTQEFARIAEVYGDGTTRLTCEENILFVNVPNEKLPAMLDEPIFQKFKVNPGGFDSAAATAAAARSSAACRKALASRAMWRCPFVCCSICR